MKIKDQLQGATAIFLILIITSISISSLVTYITFKKLECKVAVYVVKNNDVVIDLNDYKIDQNKLNKAFSDMINMNNELINRNSKRITQTNIDLDEVSHQECKTHIEEIWDVLERVE